MCGLEGLIRSKLIRCGFEEGTELLRITADIMDAQKIFDPEVYETRNNDQCINCCGGFVVSHVSNVSGLADNDVIPLFNVGTIVVSYDKQSFYHNSFTSIFWNKGE